MKYILSVCLIALLMACSAKMSPVQSYRLPIEQSAGAGRGALVYIAPVDMADHLNVNGIVYQTGPVEFQEASYHKWAGRVDRQIQDSVAAELRRNLPGYTLAVQSYKDPLFTVELTVADFHGRYDGYAVFSGEWLIKKGDVAELLPFCAEYALEAEGYEALVMALSVAVKEEAKHLSTELLRLAQ